MAYKPTSTTIDPNTKLGNERDGVVVDKEMYQRLLGRLIYLSCTRLYIAFAMS